MSATLKIMSTEDKAEDPVLEPEEPPEAVMPEEQPVVASSSELLQRPRALLVPKSAVASASLWSFGHLEPTRQDSETQASSTSPRYLR